MKYNNNTYRFVALFLVFLMLFTSVGFSIDMHFCQGDIKSFSLIGKAKNCHEQAERSTLCKHHQIKMVQSDACDKKENKDCCENRTINLDSKQEQQIQTVDFSLTKPFKQFLTAYIYTFYQDNLNQKQNVFFTHYRPPLISRDIPILVQSFLL